MRPTLFRSAQTLFKNATARPFADHVSLPPDAFKPHPGSTAFGIGMSLVVSATAAGMWMHERRSKQVTDNNAVDNLSARKRAR